MANNNLKENDTQTSQAQTHHLSFLQYNTCHNSIVIINDDLKMAPLCFNFSLGVACFRHQKIFLKIFLPFNFFFTEDHWFLHKSHAYVTQQNWVLLIKK